MAQVKLLRKNARYAKVVADENGNLYDFEYYGAIERNFIGGISYRHHVLTSQTYGSKIELTGYQTDRSNYTLVEVSYEPLLDDLWDKAYYAHTGTSFSPEVRQEDTIYSHENELLEDLSIIPESEQDHYVAKYKENYSHWLASMSRCTSTMITGGSGYNVRRHDKVHGWERSASDNFRTWRTKALEAIARNSERDRRNNLTDSQRIAEDFKPLRKEIIETYATPATWKKALCYGKLERVAVKGNVEMMERSIEFIKEMEERMSPIFTPRHKVWKLVELATSMRERLNDKMEQETEIEDNGICEVHRNHEADRLQLIFDGKPSAEVISILKQNGYRWSPRFGAWQRQLTVNATNGLDRVLSQIKAAM